MRKLLILAVSYLAIAHAEAKTLIVAMPAHPSAEAREHESEFVGNVFQQLKPGDTLIAFDASNLKKIATLQMPEKIEDGRRGRIKALGPEAGRIADFVASGDSHPENVMDIPGTLREIGKTILPSLPDHRANVMFVGSLIYDNPREIKFTNREYAFSDGFLNQKGGTFGVRGEETILRGALVSICYTDKPEGFLSERFRAATVAFWGKSVAGRGGQVGSIESYNPGCPARLVSDAVDTAKYEIDMKEKEFLRTQHWVPVEVR